MIKKLFGISMQISGREKNILILAALVAAVFVISNLFPVVGEFYQDRSLNIETVELDIAREIRLIEDTLRWRERRVVVDARRADLEAELFSGVTIPIVEANIQRELSLHARDSDITVSSTRLAERLETDGWLQISQEMSFRTNDAGNTVSFLEKLENSMPRLRVTEFRVNRSRNQYSGSITVVGFARSLELVSEETGTR